MNRPQTQAAIVTLTSLTLIVLLVMAFRAPSRRQADGPGPDSQGTTAARQAAQPSRSPDRIILTWKGAPATTQAVTWRTDKSVVKGAAQIALADAGAGVEPGWRDFDPGKVRTLAAGTEPLKTAVNEANYHSVNFEGLRPATKYMYRVGGDADWSEWFHFTTASEAPEPFGFIYFGDAQNGIKSLWSRVARGAYSDMPRAGFIVHAGDLVDRGDSDADWDEWHAAAGWVNGMVPSVPTPGNHEYGGGPGLTAHWRPQFALPENGPPGLEETCYFLDYQGTRVVSLNTNERVPEQTAWLEGVLASRPPGIRWTVVAFHHPVYSTSFGRDNRSVREAWRPVFDRYGVDLVLQGHDHGYGRSGLMRDDNLLSGVQARTARGTVYVVSVSGAKLYGVDHLPWAVRTGESVQLYQLIRIDSDRLKFESRTARGDVHDAFELLKRPDGGNDIEERDVAGPTVDWNVPSPRGAAPKPVAPAAESSGPGAVLAAAVILGAIVVGLWVACRRPAGAHR